MDFRQDSEAPALTRQTSVYSLTFDELQSTMGGMGKDFGSMNMDEFLKNIWSAEESQAMAAALGAPEGGASGTLTGLQRQGSLTLPRTLSQKTVDEVWRDVIRENVGGARVSEFQQHQQLQHQQPQHQQPQQQHQQPQQQHQQPQQQRQQTLGEMTLEEFLVRAGVVREEINTSVSRPVGNCTGVPAGSSANRVFYGDSSFSENNNAGLALSFSQAARSNVGIMQSSIPGSSGANLAMSVVDTGPYPMQLPLGSNVDLTSHSGMRAGGLVGIGDPSVSNGLITGVVGLAGGGGTNVGASVSPANHMAHDGLTKGNGELSSVSPVPYIFSGGLRGRKCSGAVEKVVERRQRRMIKNRESAARSRARKQAYTMELEAEVAKLKEQNQELQKKQAEIMEKQKNQVIEMLDQQRGTKKMCLRRTQTGPW